MAEKKPFDKLLQASLKGELRVMNAHLPRYQKSLSDLLTEEYPSVELNDGSIYLFKRKEIEYLAGVLEPEEHKFLLLPMLIEFTSDRGEAAIIIRHGIEEKVIKQLLNMPITKRHGRIIIYKPQLAILRKHLKSATQYVFSPKISA